MPQTFLEFNLEQINQNQLWRWAYLNQLTPEIKSRIREYLLPPELYMLDQFEALRATYVLNARPE